MSPLRKPKAISKEKPLEKEPEAMPANNNKMAQDGSNMAHPYSEKYGVAGGDPLTHFNPTLHKHPGPLGNTPPSNLGVLPFGEGMTPPKTLQHYPVRFSREALEARVEGLAVVRCTITVEGKVINCRFLQKLPYMDEAILHALYRRQYSPAMFQGKPISVDYNIPIRLKLP
ncbi:MAG: energy transducer TonB [Cystobacterineae bacterium]|nr:energy transducer TonB [Cystobacterineae bacterium]